MKQQLQGTFTTPKLHNERIQQSIQHHKRPTTKHLPISSAPHPTPHPNSIHSDSKASVNKALEPEHEDVVAPCTYEILGRVLGARKHSVGSGLGIVGIGRQSNQIRE